MGLGARHVDVGQGEVPSEDTPEQLMALWRHAVARSHDAITVALTDDGLDSWSGIPRPMVGHGACGDSWSTPSRSTPGTSAMPTSAVSRSMGSSERTRATSRRNRAEHTGDGPSAGHVLTARRAGYPRAGNLGVSTGELVPPRAMR
jgi:hypothetical protein